MYIATVPNRGSPPAVLLRESYRENGGVKTRTLANLSRLPAKAIEAVRHVLEGQALVPVGEVFAIVEDGSRPHGHVEAVLLSMQRLGLAELIASRRSRERDLVIAMVAARLLQPKSKSKLATTRWWHTTTLAEELAVVDADEDELYAAMDWLLERQSKIEKKLAARHLEEDGLALYDLSSSYFEGVKCPLAALGHNRDGKRGKLQVNYGLLTNRSGTPVAVSVFEGNTGDPTTLLPQVDKIRDEFGIERFVMVGDRGMITQKQITAICDRKDRKVIAWITALRSEAIRDLVEGGTLQMSLFDERNLFEISSHPDYPGERLVACRNPFLAKHRAETRKALLLATRKELEKVQKRVEHGRLVGQNAISEHLAKAVASGLEKHVRFTIREDGFDVFADEDKVVFEAMRTVVIELEKVQRCIKGNRLHGKSAIEKRLDKVLTRGKTEHVRVDVREDGFDFTIDSKAVLAEVMAPFSRKLDKVRQRIAHGALHGKDVIGLRVGKVINKYKMSKHFVLDIRDDGFDFSIDENKVAAEAALDGIYVVRTSLSKDQMDADNTVRSYKALTQVERAFRAFKTLDLNVRPIHHHLENRVRAHIFLCMLAYYVEWHMIEAWRPLLFCDEDQAAKATRDPVAKAQRSAGALAKDAKKHLDDKSPVHSFHTLLDLLAARVRNTCCRKGAAPDEATFVMVTPPNSKQQHAYHLLNTIKLP